MVQVVEVGLVPKQTYKEYLEEYYKYFNSFSDVVDHHGPEEKDGDELSRVEDDDFASDGEKVEPKKRRSRKHRRGDKDELNPRRFRQWMEISGAGD